MSTKIYVPYTQWAVVDQNERFTSIMPYSGYIRSLPEDFGYVIYLEPDASEETLGRGLLEALSKSRFIHPDDEGSFFEANRIVLADKRWHQDFMSRFGYKTLRQAYKNMRYCKVTRREGQISIAPHLRDKPRYWRDLPPDMDVVIPQTTDPVVAGAALKLALSRCE